MGSRWRALRAGLWLSLALVGSHALATAAAHAQGLEVFDSGAEDLRSEGGELTADVLEYESARGVYIARGNVVVRQGDRVLSADWIAFHPDTGAGVASGNVVLVDAGETLRAEFVQFDTESLQGMMRDAFLDSEASRFRTSGARIEKTGENTYTFEDGVFTTCRCADPDDPEPWRLRAESADVEINGYGTLKNATVEVLGVPVFWLPWMIYPIKTERQSGFLFPDISLASRDGFGLGLPFFWAVRDDVNAVFTPRWSVNRGFKQDVELEYVFGEASGGELFAAYAHDLDVDANSRDEPFSDDRWGARGRQDFRGPGGLRFASEFRLASDNQYVLDYDDLEVPRSTRYLESNASLAGEVGSAGRLGAVAAVHFADDLQSPDDLDRDQAMLQRLPSVDVTLLPGPAPLLSFLKPSVDAEYTYFDSRDRPPLSGAGFIDSGIDGVLDVDERVEGPGPMPGGPAADLHGDDASTGGTEGDGLFQEGEILTDEGHRVILHPKVAVPFRLGPYLEVMPEAGWQQTFYSTRLEGGDQRGRFTGRIDLRSRLRRRFGETWVHVVEPLAGWAYLSGAGQRNNPLFVPGTAIPQDRIRTLQLDSVTGDPSDRVGQAHELTFGVAQRWFQWGDAGGAGAVAADLTLLARYDVRGGDFEDVILDGRLSPDGGGRLRFALTLDPEAARVNEALASWTWTHAAGHQLGFGYRFLRDIPDVFEDFGTGDRFDRARRASQVNQLSAGARVAVTDQWTLGYRAAYSFETGLLLTNTGLIEYVSACRCWAIGLELSQDRARGVEVRVRYRLVGLGDDEDRRRESLLDAL